MVRNIHSDAQTRVIAAPAQFSDACISDLDHQIMQAILDKPERVSLDLAGVHSVDSAALNWMLGVQQRLKTQNIQFALSAPSSLCDAVLVATRLDQRFTILTPDSVNPEIRHG